MATCSSLTGVFQFFRADRQEAVDGQGIVRAGCSHHDGVCLVWVGVRGNYQKNDFLAVEPEDFDGVDRLEAISVESYRSPVCCQFPGCLCPFVEAVDHAVNGPESN